MRATARTLDERATATAVGSITSHVPVARLPRSAPSVPAALGWTWRRAPSKLSLPILTSAALAAVCCGVVATAAPVEVLAATAVASIVVVVMLHPPAAAYLLVTLTPLIVGINRGAALPLLRPNEALAVVLALALGARALLRMRTAAGHRLRLRLNRIDTALLAFTVSASILPLLVMTLRHRAITSDDVSYALVPWKFAGIYVIVCASVRTVQQVKRCLMLALASASVVAVIALLQVAGVGPIPRLLNQYYAPLGVVGSLATGRGSSTLGLPAATGDLMLFGLALAAAALSVRIGPRRILGLLALLFALGTLATAEFSSALGLLVAVVLICIVNRNSRFLLAAAGSLLLGWLLLQNAIESRLNGFHNAQGVPASWSGRLHNLHTYFWPELFSGWNPVLGVRVSSRVPVSTQARQYVWIESGYTWLLWAGGIPLLLAFCFLIARVLGTAHALASGPPDALTAVARTLVVAAGVLAVLMVFDPHVTYRGSADAFYMLLALLGVRRPKGDTARSQIAVPASHHPRGD